MRANLRERVRGLMLAALPLVALALLLGPARGADGLTPAQQQAVDTAVQAELKRQQVVGAAVGIVRGGEIVSLKGYGLANRETSAPVTTRTLFRWASCSKPVTAVAAMQLVEKGQLDLEADVRGLVPEFPDKGVRITLRQLLSHTGGIVHYGNGKVVRTQRTYDTPHPFESVILALDTFKESPLVNQPGEKYSYTTHGFILASAVVERAGKQRFVDQVSERILKPLGMTSMQPDYEWRDLPERTMGYRKVGGNIVRSVDGDVSWKLGGGGYTSNIEDFARFARGLVNRRLVREATERQMWTAQKLNSGAATSYGLGFGVAMTGGRLHVSHGGAQEKTRTLMDLYPSEEAGIVVMCNSEFAQPGGFVKVIEAALAGQ